MNLGDLHKVWEIKALKRKPKHEEAQKILERIAKQVQPIMRKHNWRVKLLSEFWYQLEFIAIIWLITIVVSIKLMDSDILRIVLVLNSLFSRIDYWIRLLQSQQSVSAGRECRKWYKREVEA